MGQDSRPFAWGMPAGVAALAAVIVGAPLIFYGLHLTHRPVVNPTGQAMDGMSGPMNEPGVLLTPFPTLPGQSSVPPSPGRPSGSPSPSPSTTGATDQPTPRQTDGPGQPDQPGPQQPPPAPPKPAVKADVHMAFNYNGVAYTLSARIFNNGSQPVNGWTLTFDANPGNLVAQNDVVVRNGGPGTVLLSNAFDNSAIPVGGSITFYFTLTGTPNVAPQNCVFNNTSCTIEVIKVLTS